VPCKACAYGFTGLLPVAPSRGVAVSASTRVSGSQQLSNPLVVRSVCW
jgi:hypothetical protein